MNRTQKAAEVESLKSKFVNSQLTLVTEYQGLDVASVTELRKALSKDEATLKVVKNRLAKIALKDTPCEELSQYFVGATAITVTEGDPVAPAKTLSDFAKTHEELKVKVGFLDGKLLTPEEVKMLATMPSKEELLAKLLGSMQAPATNLVSVLSQIPRQLVQVLSAVKDQKGS